MRAPPPLAVALLAAVLTGCAFTDAPSPIQQRPPSIAEEKTATLLGVGVNIPIDRAIQQIIPPGWTWRVDTAVDKDARVSWSGGRPWPDVLSDTLLPLGLAAHQAGPRHIIVGRTEVASTAAPGSTAPQSVTKPDSLQAPLASAPAAPTEPGPATSTVNPSTAPAITAPVPSSAPLQSAPQEWQVKAGQTLRSALTDWADRAGWAVQWDYRRDYPIVAPAVFQTDFQHAVEAIIGAFSTANPPVSARLYTGNKVVEVVIAADSED